MTTVVVMGQMREGGVKDSSSSGMVYTLQTDVEFTFNYQMIPYHPFRHFLM